MIKIDLSNFDVNEMNIFKYLRLHFLVDNIPCSIRNLGKEIGISYSIISEIESGTREVSLNVLKAYHEFFGVSYEVLLGEKTLKRKNNSFDTLLDKFGSSSYREDKCLFGTYIKMGTTDSGLVLLSYLDDYLNQRIDLDRLSKAIETWKSFSGKEGKEYSYIKQVIENRLNNPSDED